MKNSRRNHWVNVVVGAYLLLYSVWGFVSLLLSAPVIFGSEYIERMLAAGSSGVAYFVGNVLDCVGSVVFGCLFLLCFIRRRTGKFIGWLGIFRAIGFVVTDVLLFIETRSFLSLYYFARSTLPVLVVLCGLWWHYYCDLSRRGEAPEVANAFPYVHELRMALSRDDAPPKAN